VRLFNYKFGGFMRHKLFLLCFSVIVTAALSFTAFAKQQVTLEYIEKEYALSYPVGGATAEEVFAKVIKAVIAKNFDAYAEVSYNTDIVIYKSIEQKLNFYEEIKASGNDERIKQVEKIIDSLLTEEAKNRYKQAGELQTQKHKETFQRMIKVFNKYLDPKDIDLSKIEHSRNGKGNTESEKMLKYYFEYDAKHKEAYVSLTLVKFKGRWYANGHHGAGI
jgi:hypothetical protein